MANHEERLCSRLELMSVYRTNQQIYSNVIVAMRYKPKQTYTKDTLKIKIEKALRSSVIPSNPLLACRIIDGNTHQPKFQRRDIQQLPVQLIVDWTDIGDFLRRDHDDRPSNEALWHLSILPERESDAFWVSFAFHHAIGDGTSGLIFHEQLLDALEDSSKPDFSPDKPSPLPPPIEACSLDTTVSWKTLSGYIPDLIWMPSFLRRKYFEAEFYAGNATSKDQRYNNQTGLLSLKLDHKKVQALRKFAKANSISIHALLHGAFAHSIDTEMPIKTITPISLRPLLPVDQRRNIAPYMTAYPSITKLDENPILTAKAFYMEINDSAARKRALETLECLQHISNTPASPGRSCGMEQFYLDKLNTEEPHCLGATFEISNLGNWQPPELKNWHVDDIHFTGSNSSVGELFNLGVVTLAGGLMNLSCTWRTGYVDVAEVGRLLDKFERTLNSFID